MESTLLAVGAIWGEGEELSQFPPPYDREDPPRWMMFDMESEYEDQAPRQLAPRMVEAALGPR